MPSAVAKSTEAASPLTADSVTVKLNAVLPLLPSASETSAMLMPGAASSFAIVPVATPSKSVALVGPESVSVNVSSASNSVSPFTTTVTVPLAWPAGIVNVPLFAA